MAGIRRKKKVPERRSGAFRHKNTPGSNQRKHLTMDRLANEDEIKKMARTLVT
jgi:hypothetical protein